MASLLEDIFRAVGRCEMYCRTFRKGENKTAANSFINYSPPFFSFLQPLLRQEEGRPPLLPEHLQIRLFHKA